MTDLERIKGKIERAYAKALEKDKELINLAQKIKDGKANYDDVLKFSQAVSKIQTKAFFDHMTLDQLTEEEANFLFSPTVEDGYDQIAQAAYDVQQHLNELAGLGLEPQIAPIDQEMLDGLMQKVSEGPWEETKKYLDDQLECFFQKSVDRHAEANAKLHYKVGMSPKIIRKAAPGCCEWCVKQAGTYLYDPGMSRNVFRRHTRCRCSVLYDPVDGSKQLQDAHSKEWIDEKTRDQYLEWQASKSGVDFGTWLEESKKESGQVTADLIGKLNGVMAEDDQKEFLERINNAPDYIKRSYGYMNELKSIIQSPTYDGYFKPSDLELVYSLDHTKDVDKFSVIAHEYGHFIDHSGNFSNLSFTERDAYAQSSWVFKKRVKANPSSSDDFISALRKDREVLTSLYKNAPKTENWQRLNTFALELKGSNASQGVQDALTGFGCRDELKWGHSEKYYERTWRDIYKFKTHKELKKLMKANGLAVKNLDDVAYEMRIFETASEVWANITSATVSKDDQLLYIKRYLPNSYEAFDMIMKGLEDAKKNEL